MHVRARRYEYNWAILPVTNIHALRASQPQSARRFGPARGCRARQRATAKPCTAVDLSFSVDLLLLLLPSTGTTSTCTCIRV